MNGEFLLKAREGAGSLAPSLFVLVKCPVALDLVLLTRPNELCVYELIEYLTELATLEMSA